MQTNKIKALLISNMYPSKNSYLGIFVKIQIEFLEQQGIEVIKVVKSKNGMFRYIGFLLKTLFFVLFKKFDIVHAHYGFHSAFIPALIKRKPLVITFHGSDALLEPFRNKTYNRLQKYVIRKADHLIAVSTHVKKNLIEKLGATEQQVSVISCGVDAEYFRAMNVKEARAQVGIPEKSKVVLFAGKISFMKGLDVIYQCSRRMADVLFIVAGTPVFEGQSENCRYVGLIQNKDMPVWLSACDLYFLPSRSEGTPVGILEALACERPVIVSNIGGCPDLITDAVNGYLIEVENPLGSGQIPEQEMMFSYHLPESELNTIVKKLRDILDNPDKKNIMGCNGREMVVKQYDNRIIAAKIIAVYKTFTGK